MVRGGLLDFSEPAVQAQQAVTTSAGNNGTTPAFIYQVETPREKLLNILQIIAAVLTIIVAIRVLLLKRN